MPSIRGQGSDEQPKGIAQTSGGTTSRDPLPSVQVPGVPVDEKLEIKKKLVEKYSKLTPEQQLESISKKLSMIGLQEAKQERITKLISNSTEALAKYQKTLVILLSCAIGLFIVYIIYKFGVVYLSYRSFISWINSAGSSTTTWPTGGFGTALALAYPIMTGWFGFTDPYLPLAAFETWQYYGNTVLKVTGDTVNNSAAYVLGQMYCFATLAPSSQQGSCGTDSATGRSVWDIICCGWGNANSVDPCVESYCASDLSTMDYITSASSGLNGGINGGFAAHMAGGGAVGMGIGTLLMAGATFGLSIWQAKQQKQANADANGCAQ